MLRFELKIITKDFNYASWAHAEFFVTTNEKETKYFNVDPAYLTSKIR